MNIIVDKNKANVPINVDINEGALWSTNFTPFSNLLKLIIIILIWMFILINVAEFILPCNVFSFRTMKRTIQPNQCWYYSTLLLILRCNVFCFTTMKSTKEVNQCWYYSTLLFIRGCNVFYFRTIKSTIEVNQCWYYWTLLFIRRYNEFCFRTMKGTI